MALLIDKYGNTFSPHLRKISERLHYKFGRRASKRTGESLDRPCLSQTCRQDCRRESFKPNAPASLLHVVFYSDDIFQPRRLIGAQINRCTGTVHEMTLNFGLNEGDGDNAAFDGDHVFAVNDDTDDGCGWTGGAGGRLSCIHACTQRRGPTARGWTRGISCGTGDADRER